MQLGAVGREGHPEVGDDLRPVDLDERDEPLGRDPADGLAERLELALGAELQQREERT